MMRRLWVGCLAVLVLGACAREGAAQSPSSSTTSGAGGAAPAARRGLEICFIDVMGGASTLLVTPEGESILIDTGWPTPDDRDPKRIVHALKDVAGCDHLDHLVITHWHRDHFGGVAGLARLVRIDHFWDHGLPEDAHPHGDFPEGPKKNDPLGRAYRAASRGKRQALRPGGPLPLKSQSVHALVLASGGAVIEPSQRYGRTDDLPKSPACADVPPDRPADPSDNARSVALLFSAGKFRFYDAGDLTWNVEKKLVCPIDLVGKVDLYQVTHHGLDISNHPTLLQTLQPRVTIMNNGPRKGGLATTVRRLRTIPSIEAAYQLHRNAATGDDDNTDPALIANKDQKGGTMVRVLVAPDGANYSVQIGENGPKRQFESRP